MNQYTYHPYHNIGAADVLIWDSAALDGGGAWARVGRSADAALLMSGETLSKDLAVRGVSQPIAQRLRSRRYALSLRLLESAGPDALALLFGGGAAQSASAAGTASASEVLRLNGGEYSQLVHPYGVASSPAPVVKSYDAATTYVSNTDYELDLPQGLLRRKAGGGIPDGARVCISYSYARPAGVATPLGADSAIERYRKVKLLQLAPDPLVSTEDPASWRESGVEFELYRVSISATDTRFGFSEQGFGEGLPLVWDCLLDPTTAKVGEVRSTYGVLAQWE